MEQADTHGKRERKVPILAYHKVDRESHTRFWVSTVLFDQQMAELKDLGFESLHLHDLWLCARDERALPEKSVCITFDDGYENFASCAFPILQKYGFTATVFLPTAFIGESNRYWNDWDRSPEERSFRASHLLWSEVMDLHRRGVEFGAHTSTHLDLGELFNRAPREAEEEILASKRMIEGKLSEEILFLSYPYKASGSGVQGLARKAEFLGAVTVNDRLLDIDNCDWFCMDRIPVFSNDSGKSAGDARKEFLDLLSGCGL